MAYKEIIKKSVMAEEGQLAFEQTNPTTPDPSEEEYLIVRNALSANEPLTPTTLIVGQLNTYSSGFFQHKYTVYRSVLQFDTSIIPEGAPIEYVNLEIMVNQNLTDVDYDIIIKNGQPEFPHTPVIASDYFHENYEGDGGSINTADMGGGVPAWVYDSIILNSTGRSWIAKGSGAKTKLCLRSSRDISATKPDGYGYDERLTFFGIELAERIPQLTIRWTLSVPNPTTKDPTGVEGTGATFQGTMTSSGYWLDKYGFEYKKEIDGNIIENIVGGGVGEVGDFEKVKTGLDPNAIYYFRAFGENDAGRAVGEWKWFRINYPEILNIKAERISPFSSIRLYGEIVDLLGSLIIERGFEYKVQDAEPEEEDTGIEVIDPRPAWVEYWEEGEYHAEEYEGNDVDFWDRLYFLKENTIWWFRAYLKDDEDNKYVAETWMKSVPTMTTFEVTDMEAQQAKGHGEMTDKGADTVTRRGFRIIKEYEGDLMGLRYYDNIFGDYTLMGEIEMETLTGPGGVITGYIWRGIFYRDALWPKSQTPGDHEIGIYENIIGGGISHEGFGIYLKPNDTYKIVAIAVNQHGMGFGEGFYFKTGINIYSDEYQNMLEGLITFSTGQNILPSDPEEDEIVSEISAEKTIILGTIPEGKTVTRIGIRLGRTEGCTDIHVYEDGSWTSGQSHTFYITGFVPGATYYKMPYIILNHGDYEEEILAIPDYRNPERLEEWLEDYPIEVFPEVEDEDDLDQTVIDASVGDISYRTIIKEIKCEKIGEQSFIDRYGRRRSKTISNHLIQSRANCIIIADDYVERFQILKLKIAIDYDIPIPFEREDVILLGDGKHKLREDGEGLIPCKDDGEGEVLQEDFILAKIRKMDSRFISGSETILSLELEV